MHTAASARPSICRLSATRRWHAGERTATTAAAPASQLSPATAAQERAAREAFTVRFRVPAGSTEWDESVHGPTRWPNAEIDDFIILRTDGTPIYNLAVVSDDADMRISHVIRGDDHIANTPRQILLYRARRSRADGSRISR